MRLGDPQRAQEADLATVQPEPAEDLFLSPGEVRSDAGQACGHLQGLHPEVRARLIPAGEHLVGRVVSHGPMVAEKIVLDMVSFSRETYLALTV